MHDATKETKKKRNQGILNWLLDNQQTWKDQSLSNEDQDKIRFLMHLSGISYRDSLLFEDMRQQAAIILGDRHDYHGQI